MKNTSTYHKGQAVPLNRDNIDTDQIIPKQFLKSIKKNFSARLEILAIKIHDNI